MICGRRPEEANKNNSRLHMDHDHVTGKIRDLLCRGCNVGLGSFGDSVDRLEAAIRYLKRHKGDGI